MAWFTRRKSLRQEYEREKLEFERKKQDFEREKLEIERKKLEIEIIDTLFSLISLMLFLTCLSIMVDICLKLPPFIYEGLFYFILLDLFLSFFSPKWSE